MSPVPVPVTYGPMKPLGLRGWCFQTVSPGPTEEWLRGVRDDGRTVTLRAEERDGSIVELRRAVLKDFPETEILAPF